MPPKKKPFSNKQKKIQLQFKNSKKREKQPFGSSSPPLFESSDNDDNVTTGTMPPLTPVLNIKKPHPQAIQTVIRRYDPNRFRLQFHQESKEDIEKRKLHAKTVSVNMLPEEALEVGIDDVYRPGSVLDIPKRPFWDYSMNKQEVEKREEEIFSQYVRNIFAKYSIQDLSYFELNLETWRQLWRVLEISDVLLMITDIRHPALHFSPALYKYVVNDLQKHMVLILNKVDLVPPQVVVAWKHYFQEKFPDLSISCFSSFPNKDISLDTSTKVKFKLGNKRGFKNAFGPKELQDIIQPFYKQTNVDFQEVTTDSGAEGCCHVETNKYITVGLLGHPNVGKSSLLNGLMEKKTVSTSRTPGHTKHFQTIFLTPSIRLCDCPGLVFPSLVSKQLQILSGMYPIAQVKEPYSVVGYLAQYIPLVDVLSLNHPNPPSSVWTPWDICDAWAEKRGYYTRRGAKPDTYRAANDLLRLVVDGRICLYFRPPGYHKRKGEWSCHHEVQEMIQLQSQGMSLDERDSNSSEESINDDNLSSNDDDPGPMITADDTKFMALMNLSDSGD